MTIKLLLLLTFISIGFAIGMMTHHHASKKVDNIEVGISLIIAMLPTSLFVYRTFVLYAVRDMHIPTPSFYAVFFLTIIGCTYFATMIGLNLKNRNKFYKMIPLLLQFCLMAATSLILATQNVNI